MPSETFRFNAQKVFLTFSQTKKKQDEKWFLNTLKKKAEIQEYLIAQERHENGGYHVHAYLKFSTKLDTKNARFFDVKYYGKDYHPNIIKPKKLEHLYRYLKKDKKYITNIEETRPVWLQLLADSTSEKEFLIELMWKINRIDNYAGYKTLRDLAQMKFRPNEL